MEDAEKRFLEENDIERFVASIIIIWLSLKYKGVDYSTNLLCHNILLTFRSLEGSRNKLPRLLLIRRQFILHL